jgi:hypothetical protein
MLHIGIVEFSEGGQDTVVEVAINFGTEEVPVLRAQFGLIEVQYF